MANVKCPQTQEELTALIESRSEPRLVVVNFWMPWSEPSVQMNEVLDELSQEHEQVTFVKVEAESFPSVCQKLSVIAVPTTVFLKGGKEVDRVNGAHAPEITKKTSKYASFLPAVPVMPPPPKEDLDSRLKRLVSSAPCILFMKGTPEEPRCGFSRQMVAILQEFNCTFNTFNILADEEVRQGLKTFSNWPTFPQLYVGGEFIGGLDIIKEMKESGDLQQVLPKPRPLEERLKDLTHRAPVMLFMKGTPEEPKCGFSKQVVALLKEEGVQFESFDILQDEEVRQGLKTFSNWPTYPQVYSSGELIGGLDILKELKEAGELKSSLQT